MKNQFLQDILVLVAIIALLFVVCLFLPESIPVHFNAKGEADFFVYKYYLLLGTAVLYSAYWKLKKRK